MKFLSKALLVSILFLFSMNAFAVEDELLVLIYVTDNSTLHYAVKNKDITALASWDGEGSAPLSINTATKLATSKHKDKFGEAQINSISLKHRDTYCDKSLSCPERLWYFKAKVKGGEKRTYIILMDGSFVIPKNV